MGSSIYCSLIDRYYILNNYSPYKIIKQSYLSIGDKTTMSLMSEKTHHSALVVNLPERPLFQHPVIPPSSGTHRGAVHPMARHPESVDSQTLRGGRQSSGQREPKLHHSAHRRRATSPPEGGMMSADARSYDAIPQSLSHLKIAEKNLKFLLKLGDGVFGEVSCPCYVEECKI